MANVTQLQRILKRHSDGTPCQEGTRCIPPAFTPCCAAFHAHTSTCEYKVRYEWWGVDQKWNIAIPGVTGGGGVSISHCPHCGARL